MNLLFVLCLGITSFYSIFASANSSECPNLAGSYTCTDSEKKDYTLEIKQASEQNQVKYYLPLLDGFDAKFEWVIADGKKYGSEDEYILSECKKSTLTVTQFAQDNENDLHLSLDIKYIYKMTSPTVLKTSHIVTLTSNGKSETKKGSTFCQKQ